jgi:hypothetical protein
MQELAVRAESQRDDVERHRVQVARSALTAV